MGKKIQKKDSETKDSKILVGESSNDIKNKAPAPKIRAATDGDMQTVKKRAVVKIAQYLCPVCDLVYQSQNSQMGHIFKYHYSGMTLLGESLQCIVCPVTKPSVREIVEHVRTHQAYSMFRCGICSTIIPPEKGFRARHNLMYHRAKSINPKVSYTCSHCSEEIASPSELAYHVLLKHDDSTMMVVVNQSRDYKCNYCSLSFPKIKVLYKHIKADHGVQDEDADVSFEEEDMLDSLGNDEDDRVKNGADSEMGSAMDVLQYLCPVCDVSYQSVHLQARHFERYHWTRNEDGTFSCPTCPSTHTDLNEMVLHARTMHRDALYSCALCLAVLPPEKVYRRKHMMQEHRGQRVTTKRIHPCGECEQEQRTLSELAYHSLVEHGNTRLIAKVKRKSHQCNYCELSFVNQTSLIRHIGTTHDREPGEEPIVIQEQDDTDQMHDNSDGSQPRTKIISGDGPPYMCQPCHKVYKSSTTYIAHLRYYCGKSREEKRLIRGKEKTYLCSHCGAVLTSYSGFQTHMANHYDRHKFKCDLCPKAFAKRGQLNFHRRTHARPFICQSCGNRFKTLSHLKDHQITHSDDLSFSCPSCPQRFKWRPTLMRHLYKVHGQGLKPDSSARRKMLCLLCNMKVNSGKRTKHFQRRHKEMVYDLKYFTLITPAGTASSIGGVAGDQQQRVEIINQGLGGMDQLATAAQVIGLNEVVTTQPTLQPLTSVPLPLPPQSGPTLAPLLPVHPGATMNMTSAGVMYGPQVLEIKVADPHHQVIQQQQHPEGVAPPTYISPPGTVYAAMHAPPTTAITTSATGHQHSQEEGMTFDVVSMQAAIDAHHQQGGHYQIIQDQSGVPMVIQPQWQ